MTPLDWILSVIGTLVTTGVGWTVKAMLELKLQQIQTGADIRTLLSTLYPRDEPSIPRRIHAIEETATHNAEHAVRVEAKVDAVKESLDDHRAEAPSERRRAAREVVAELQRANRIH